MTELEDAILAVRARLQDAERAAGSYADDPTGWHRRHRAEMTHLAEALNVEVGATIVNKWDGCKVRISGLTATCTAGLSGALNNWCAAAERKLA